MQALHLPGPAGGVYIREGDKEKPEVPALTCAWQAREPGGKPAAQVAASAPYSGFTPASRMTFVQRATSACCFFSNS